MGFSAKECPIVAEFLLAFRAEFDDVKVTHLSENGVAHGSPWEPAKCSTCDEPSETNVHGAPYCYPCAYNAANWDSDTHVEALKKK